jgi:hypothetical protein
VAAEGLHGIEIDPDLCAQARAHLREAIGGPAGERAARNLRCADALDPEVPWPEATHVVANPPWVSLSGRQACRELPAERVALYRRAWPSMRGWPTLHGAFLERIAVHVAASRSSARVLLPASVCELDGYAELRRRVSALADLSAPPRELAEDAFPGVCEPSVLLELAPATRRGRGSGGPWAAVDEGVAAALQAFDAFPRLPTECFRDCGVHTGNCSAELIVRTPTPGLPGLREGKDLVAYRLGPPRIQLRAELERTPERRFRVKALEDYRAVPILLRQTADRPVAALHDDPTYFRNSLLACTPPAGLDAAFVVGVLNSPVAAAWHRLRFRDARQRSFPQVKLAHLRGLPFPILHRDEDRALHERVAASVTELCRAPRATGLAEEVAGLVTAAYGPAAEPLLGLAPP